MSDKVREGFRLFRPADVLIVVFFLSLAVLSVNLFRFDLLQTFEARNMEPVGTVVIKKNVVQRRLSDRVLWDRLGSESPVYIGDIIRIAEVSAATLNVDDHSIDLDENTLIRISLAPDGEGLQILLSEGSLSVAAGADSRNLTLDIKGRQVQTLPGVVLSAGASESGASVKVSEGTAQFIAEGQSREIVSGNAISFDSEGTERMERSVVVTQPQPNVRLLKSGSEPVLVNFAWNRINLLPRETLRLDISLDRNFTQMFRVIENLNNSAQVFLDTGLWHWRLSQGSAVLGEGRLTVADGAGPRLTSPAMNSVFRYANELPVLRFQWTAVEEASSYILEISERSDFINPRIQRQTDAVSFSSSEFDQGTWYWRVRAVFPSVYEGRSSFSQTASFRIERVAEERAAQELIASDQVSLGEWLVMEAPPSPEPPTPAAQQPPPPPAPAVQATPPRPTQAAPAPARPTPAPARQPTPPPAPVRQTPAAQPPRPASASLLPAPQNIQPVNGFRFGFAELQSHRSIEFSWSRVEGADAYIFTLYQQAQGGRRQILRTQPVSSLTYTLNDLRTLDSGAFIWQVEAVRTDSGGVVEQNGSVAESAFIMDFPAPTPVLIEDTGILYGN